ncbi:MAG: 3-isopropylmalate dehydratase large subunit, partial [Methylobacterium sp.]|nr:3-isopropylmalate dehydratase large subunit [Methylobacterium sp.]
MTGNPPRTLFDKVWQAHVVRTGEDGTSLLAIDRHFLHEGSHHAFAQLADRRARVARPDLTFGVADHYVPTRRGAGRSMDPAIAGMIERLERNTEEHGIPLFGLGDPRQGIVHVVGPEQG